ncbi:MAG: DoxX family protein [Bacillati bacterium ANGP1]|uniref:DoxX family protein n=1 Tax=Candidatus Segetimicrobium genomatis TaxID=2569760 RepID=A0A537J6H5_9BACT|nr:MAG: DoxX family protein [Terrabacteria group bacterium ANGP1]
MKIRAEAPGSGHTVRIDLALLLLRVILAAVFGTYGYLKWAGGLGRLAGLMLTVHLPFPDASARLVAALELGGAVLLLIGLGTRLIGALLAVEMAVAIATVVWPRGFVGGFAFEMTLLAVALSVAIAGGGRLSIGRGRLSR